MKSENSKRRRRKRNCFDRLKANLQKARRVRGSDPAASATMQLLSIFTVLMGRVPFSASAPVPYSPPPPSPAYVRTQEMARRLAIPRRYVGIVISCGQVPYAMLFEHVRQGGVLRRDALIELRKRIPEVAVDWLIHIEKRGRWSELMNCYVATDHEEETDLRFLTSTLRWLNQSDGDIDVQISVDDFTGPKHDIA